MSNTTVVSNPSWLDGVLISLKTQTATWIVAFMIAILTAFSGYITDAIKSALNRADARTKQQEELATEISRYIFEAYLCTEFIERNWTTKKILTERLTDYNASITTMRKKEYVYLAWVKKYWDQDEMGKFESLMTAVHEYDAAIHDLNDEIELVTITEKEPKLKPAEITGKVEKLKAALKKLQETGKAFMLSL